jgi:hypothetical protein
MPDHALSWFWKCLKGGSYPQNLFGQIYYNTNSARIILLRIEFSSSLIHILFVVLINAEFPVDSLLC